MIDGRLSPAALLLTAGCAVAHAPSASTAADVHVPSGWDRAHDVFHYAPAIRAGNFLYLSGVVAGFRDETQADEEAAYVRAFEAIGEILNAAGADWDHVIAIDTFHTDLPAQVDTFNAVKDRYLEAPYPTATAIDVDRLYPDGGLVEIKITAWLGGPRTRVKTE